jgi:predicted glycoside hydrolase/deacetylase ChbG (UPF0249 family)
MVTSPRWLIVTAEEFNRSPTAARAIRAAHDAGMVTSTSVVVTRPLSTRDLAWLKGAPTLSVGLHFSLDDGAALSAPARRVLDSSGVRRRGAAAAPLDPSVLKAELEAQYESFMGQLGSAPTHLETHHDLASRPALLAALVDMARSFSLPLRLRDEGLRACVRAASVRTVDGVLRWSAPAVRWSVDLLETVVAALPGGVHELGSPADRVVDGADAPGSLAQEELLALLCHPGVRGRIEQTGVRVVGYRGFGAWSG